MKLEHIALENLLPFGDNPRIPKDGKLRALRQSLKAFGLFKPLLIWGPNNTVIGGNMRLAAIKGMVDDKDLPKSIDIKKIPCIRFDGDEKTARAVALRDNNDDGEWDYDKLPDYIASLEGLSTDDFSLAGLTGFDDATLKDLVDISSSPDANLDRFTSQAPEGADASTAPPEAKDEKKGKKEDKKEDKKEPEELVTRQFAKFTVGNIKGNLPIAVYSSFVEVFDKVGKKLATTEIHTIVQFILQAVTEKLARADAVQQEALNTPTSEPKKTGPKGARRPQGEK